VDAQWQRTEIDFGYVDTCYVGQLQVNVRVYPVKDGATVARVAIVKDDKTIYSQPEADPYLLVEEIKSRAIQTAVRIARFAPGSRNGNPFSARFALRHLSAPLDKSTKCGYNVAITRCH
jgi:hypothetical protein